MVNKGGGGAADKLFGCPADTVGQICQSGTNFFSYLIDKRNVIDLNPGKYLERQPKIEFSSLYLLIANEKKQQH